MADEVVLYARFTAKEGSGREVADILVELVQLVQQETGLRQYTLHRGLDNPDIVWFYEVYADQSALDAHGKFPEFGAIFARLADLTEGPPELIRAEIVGTFTRS
jgi:quinol monooxygenase YgiN